MMNDSTRTSAVWLGLGEYSHPDADFGIQREARRLFLTAIKDEAPQVLAELAQEPLSLFRPLYTQAVTAMTDEQRLTAHTHLEWSGVLSWDRCKDADPAQDPDAAEFREQLTAWARRWNLDESADDWVLARAIATLLEWSASPSLFENNGPTWASDPRSTGVELSAAEMAFALPSYAWNPQWERKADARRRILDDLERNVAAELDRIEALAKQRLGQTPELKSGDAIFRWLVAYQVLALDWPEVARRFERSTKRVRDAGDIAPRVGITLRKGRPPGRPRTRPLRDARPQGGSGSRPLRTDRPTAPSAENN